jgi:Kef-type K+ transport system membrane component KefB
MGRSDTNVGLPIMMNASSVFLLTALIIVSVPVMLLRVSGLKGLLPLVVVQIAVGIAMGPSVFGRIAPEYFQIFANPQTLSSFSGVAFVGVLIFGMISGLHLDPGVFNGNERGFWAMAAANVAVPMVLGSLAGFWILVRVPDELLPGVTHFEFMAAIGICVSMSALPVLGAILGEMGLLGRRIGHLALGVAGINNMILWILLGLLLTAAAGHGGEAQALPPVYLLVLLPVYLVVMVKFVRPLLIALVTARMRNGVVSTGALVLIGAATIASALATELMGLHYIIGAFLIGAMMPAHLHEPILDRLQVMTVALLMPFFFTLTGMRTLIDLSSPTLLEILVITAAAAAVGIIGGTAAAARLFGEKWSVAFCLGSLLQSKGLTELIVLSVLLEGHIISSRIFSAMIVMALVCTAMAMPLARLALGRLGEERKSAGAPVAAILPGE